MLHQRDSNEIFTLVASRRDSFTSYDQSHEGSPRVGRNASIANIAFREGSALFAEVEIAGTRHSIPTRAELSRACHRRRSIFTDDAPRFFQRPTVLVANVTFDGDFHILITLLIYECLFVK